MLLLLLALFALAAAAYFVGEAASVSTRERHLSVQRAAGYGRFRISRPGADHKRFSERALGPFMGLLAQWALRLSPRTTGDAITMKLLAAGLGRRFSPTGFLALKGLFGGSGALLGFLAGQAAKGSGAGLAFGLFFGAIGFFGPDYALTLAARRRNERIKAQLPDALDLLAVSVEAGLGFDGAVAKLCEYLDGPLAEEFGMTLGEMRIGESRSEALKRFADRVSIPEVSSFTRSIIQADQLGTSLGRILRVQAADTRLRRQAAAEERAMKAPIKMLFPTVLFIFPAMFLVILGPAILNIEELF